MEQKSPGGVGGWGAYELSYSGGRGDQQIWEIKPRRWGWGLKSVRTHLWGPVVGDDLLKSRKELKNADKEYMSLLPYSSITTLVTQINT